MAKDDKKLTMAELAKKLNKEYNNDNLILKSDIVPAYERLSTGLLGMDYTLFGGLPEGRLVVFAGTEGSGKTTGACAQLAAYQKKYPKKTCLFVDVEQSLDAQFQAIMNGLDLNRLLWYRPDGQSGEQILSDVLNFLDTEDVGMVVIDSIPALIPQASLDNDFEKDMGQRETIAKPLHKFCKEACVKLARNQNILILINQVREVGKTFTGATIYGEPGGGAPKYYASVKVRFGTRTFIKDGEDLKSSDGEGATGFRLKFKITKNKTARPSRGGGFITYDYEKGADSINDMIDIALTFGFIRRVNNVTYELVNLATDEVITDSDTGEVMRNKKKYLITYLQEHPRFRDEYLKMLKEFISASNDKSLLSKEETKEIDAMEKSVNKQEQSAEEYEKEQAKFANNRAELKAAGYDPDTISDSDLDKFLKAKGL